jgi:hypothetical protein
MFGGLDKNIMKYLGGNKTLGVTNETPLKKALGVMWGSPALFNVSKFGLHDANVGTMFDKTKHTANLELINTSVLSIETATITETPIEEWIGGQWVYTHGRPEMRQITFTFRDSSNSWLYRNFNMAKNTLRNSFPDEQKWTLQVDTHSAVEEGKGGRFSDGNFDFNAAVGIGNMVYTDHAILESISSVTLDQSNSDGFLTFSVTFKYINPIHNIKFDGEKQATKNPLTDIQG